jgi:dGTPase
MQLTAATLGAYSKYPTQSLLHGSELTYAKKSTKKYGFFQAEKEIFKELASILGLLERDGEQYCWVRHPLAFVTEAADDICYRIVDLEDAYNQKLIPLRAVEEILEKLLTDKQIDRVKKEEESDRMEVIRALAIGEAINGAVAAFSTNYEGIMRGSFDDDLIAHTKVYEGFETIKALQEKLVYRSDRVLKIEIAGFSVISGLLDHFVKAANDIVENNRLSQVMIKKRGHQLNRFFRFWKFRVVPECMRKRLENDQLCFDSRP